jgi:hypothetical protein
MDHFSAETWRAARLGVFVVGRARARVDVRSDNMVRDRAAMVNVFRWTIVIFELWVVLDIPVQFSIKYDEV